MSCCSYVSNDRLRDFAGPSFFPPVRKSRNFLPISDNICKNALNYQKYSGFAEKVYFLFLPPEVTFQQKNHLRHQAIRRVPLGIRAIAGNPKRQYYLIGLGEYICTIASVCDPPRFTSRNRRFYIIVFGPCRSELPEFFLDLIG